MLIKGFYWDRMNVVVAEGLEESLGVGAIGLVAHSVGACDVRREQDHRMSEALELSSPVMGGAAGFEEHC